MSVQISVFLFSFTTTIGSHRDETHSRSYPGLFSPPPIRSLSLDRQGDLLSRATGSHYLADKNLLSYASILLGLLQTFPCRLSLFTRTKD